MAQPPAYNRSKDFTENFGTETDHSALNAELDTAANSINDIRANLAILQADDGMLRPAVVTTDSITDTLRQDLISGATDAVQSVLDQALIAVQNAENAAEMANTSARLAQNSADEAIDTADEAVDTALRALHSTDAIPATIAQNVSDTFETLDIDQRIATTVREAIDSTPIPGLTADTITHVLGYQPYNGDTNPNSYLTESSLPEQAQPDWLAEEGTAHILNRPQLAPVATTGEYSDLANAPVLAPVATSGSYRDLTDQPAIIAIPTGLIAMWSGSADAIPTGWVLCDGENNTPDLRNRFIVGAGSTYAVDATGGATSRTISSGVGATTLTTSQIPSHTHTYVAKAAMHRYGTTSNDNHIYAPANTTATNTGATGGGGSHTHSFSAAVSILPPYYALCFIMKS